MLKPLTYVLRKVVDHLGKVHYEPVIPGKKASIVALCRRGKLHPRKCRKYPLS